MYRKITVKPFSYGGKVCHKITVCPFFLMEDSKVYHKITVNPFSYGGC